MKRLASVALALSLLSGTAAVAAPTDHGNQGSDGGYSSQDRGYNNQDRDHRDNNGAAVVAGVGILALAAILASQHRHHDGWHDRDGGRYRDGNGRGYDSSYGERHSGYGDNGRR